MTSLDILADPGAQLIKQTRSVCPSCLIEVPAEVLCVNNTVVMRKQCAQHGSFETLLASDAKLYWEPVGDAVCGTGCCSGGHSCTLIFEVTERCNLSCPTCFTDSSPQRDRSMSLEQFGTQLEALLGKGKGTADIVQLSGGEPTTHPDIEAMIELCFERGVERVYLNTNGVRLAKDAAFAERLGEINAKTGNDGLQLYLQFDGFRPSTHQLLRGVDSLADIKHRALSRMLEHGIYVLPVMTVTRGVNLDEIGALIRMALQFHPKTNCVMLQPAFYAGRYENERPAQRLTTAEIAHEVAAQCGGMFDVADFGPLPCGHPNCFAMAVGMVRGGELIPVSRYFPRIETWDQPEVSAQVSRFADRMPQTLLEQLGDDELVDTLLDMLASGDDDIDWSDYRSFFMVGIKPFMDAHSFDQDRIDKCCVHVVDPEGKPRSLCEYNVRYRDQP